MCILLSYGREGERFPVPVGQPETGVMEFPVQETSTAIRWLAGTLRGTHNDNSLLALTKI